MVVKLARVTQKVTGRLLSSLLVAVEAGNIMICVGLILFAFGVMPLHIPPQA